jgi:hypothetical protein
VEVNEHSREALDFLDLSQDRRALVDIGANTGFFSAMFARSRCHPARAYSRYAESTPVIWNNGGCAGDAVTMVAVATHVRRFGRFRCEAT